MQRMEERLAADAEAGFKHSKTAARPEQRVLSKAEDNVTQMARQSNPVPARAGLRSGLKRAAAGPRVRVHESAFRMTGTDKLAQRKLREGGPGRGAGTVLRSPTGTWDTARCAAFAPA